MSNPDIDQLGFILQNLDKQDANGKKISYEDAKPFKKLCLMNDQQVNQDLNTLCYQLIEDTKASTHTRLYTLKVMNSCKIVLKICLNQNENEKIEIYNNNLKQYYKKAYQQYQFNKNIQFITTCLLEANILFLEDFQDHQIMIYFSGIAFEHTFSKDENTFGTHYLNSNNPQQNEKLNSQTFIKTLLETLLFLSQNYPVRQNKQKSVSEFRQLVENMIQSGNYLPEMKIKKSNFTNLLIQQNYVGLDQSNQNNPSQLQQATPQQQQGNNQAINSSQAQKGTPQPQLQESMMGRARQLTASDYNQIYKENLKTLEQIKTQLNQNEFQQNVEQYIQKMVEYSQKYQQSNIQDDKLAYQIQMIQILDGEVQDHLEQYKRSKNLQELKNYYKKQYDEQYREFISEPYGQDNHQQDIIQEQQEIQKQQELLERQREEDERKKRKEEEKIQLQQELAYNENIKRQNELQQQQLIKKQREEEEERKREIEKQMEQERQKLERQKQEKQQIQDYTQSQQQSIIRDNKMHNRFNEDQNDENDHIQINTKQNQNFNHNIHQNFQNKLPSTIEEENEDFPNSNKNSHVKQDNKKFLHHSLNQSNFKSNNNSELRSSSRFQAALNDIADLEKHKLRESRISARSHYDQERSQSFSRLDPNKSKPIINKSISREDHKLAINKQKEEQARLEKIIFSKDAEISSLKDAIKMMTKESLEQKATLEHFEKDIMRYQQKIQLYESGSSKENDKQIQQFNLLEQELNEEKQKSNQCEEKNQNLILEKLDLIEQNNFLTANKNELEQKLARLQNDLGVESQKQQILEDRVTEKLSKNQSQLEKGVTQLNSDKFHLEQQIKNLGEDYENLLKQFNVINKENLHLKNDFAQYRIESDLHYNQQISAKTLRQLDEYEHLVSELRNQTIRLSDENKKIFEQSKAYNKELSNKELEIEALNDKIMSLENDKLGNEELKLNSQIKTTNENHKYIEMRQKWQEEKNQQLESINKCKKEIKMLKDQNDELNQLIVIQYGQLQDVRKDMVQQKNTHNDDLAKFLSENTKQFGNELGEKDEFINQLKREILQKNKLLEEEKMDYDQHLQQEQMKVATSNMKIQHLEQELENMNSLLQQSNNNENELIEKFKQQVDQIQEDLENQVQLNQEQNEFIFQFQRDITQEKKLNEELKQKIHHLNDEIKKQNQKISQLEVEKQGLSEMQTNLFEQHQNLMKKYQDLKQSNQTDMELVIDELVGELQEINNQLQNRINVLLSEAGQQNNQHQEQVDMGQAFSKFEKADIKMYNNDKHFELGGDQDVENMMSNSMLSDARRINDALDETNKQKNAYNSQSKPVKLSELGSKRSQRISTEGQYFSNQRNATIPHNISPKYLESQNNYETIPGKFAQDMRHVDPENAALIFPLQSPAQYQENKAPKNVKGKLIRNDYNLFNYLPQNQQILYKFKRGSLKENFPLFQNEDIQIGMISKLIKEDRSDLLEVVLYFTNRTDDVISDFNIQYNAGQTNSLELDPLEIDNQLFPGVQKQQRLYIGINEIPFDIILIDLSYRSKNKSKRFNLALPNTVNKFFEPQQIDDISNFKYLWNSCKDQIYRSEEITLDEKIAKISTDFISYFKNLIDINDNNQQEYILGLNENKIAGCFYLKASNTKFLLKIAVGPYSQAIFQVGLLDQPIDSLQKCVLEYIIQSLSLVFRSDH